MERDEQRTHELWRALRSDLISPKVSSHKGQIVKSTGDGVLIEFGTALEAVDFALEIQRALAGDKDTGGFDPLRIRVSIHMGPIIAERDDIFGDDVNIAARLLGYVDGGEIAISGVVHDEIRSRVSCHLVDLGFLVLKNLERRVRAYKISSIELPAPSLMDTPGHRPSVAVLPLRTHGLSERDGYFAIGITHDIIALLASMRELFVVSSGSTLALADIPIDPTNVRHILGVRYVLTGTMSVSGDRYRIVVELSDTDSRSVVWTNRFDFKGTDFFSIQEEIATNVAYALSPHIRFTEFQKTLVKSPESLDAYQNTLRAMYTLSKLGEENLIASKQLLELAIVQDPYYGLAYTTLAQWYLFKIGEGHSHDLKHDTECALKYASMGLVHSPADPLALAISGHVHAFLYANFDEAIQLFDLAIASCPSSAIACGLSAPTYCYLGDAATAISRAKRALALSPIEPFAYWYRTALTLANYFNGTYRDAIFWGRRTLAIAPRFVANMRPLIGSLVAVGNIVEAQEVAQRLLDIDPDFRVEPFCQWYPLANEDQKNSFQFHLLAAGLPK